MDPACCGKSVFLLIPLFVSRDAPTYQHERFTEPKRSRPTIPRSRSLRIHAAVISTSWKVAISRGNSFRYLAGRRYCNTLRKLNKASR